MSHGYPSSSSPFKFSPSKIRQWTAVRKAEFVESYLDDSEAALNFAKVNGISEDEITELVTKFLACGVPLAAASNKRKAA